MSAFAQFPTFNDGCDTMNVIAITLLVSLMPVQARPEAPARNVHSPVDLCQLSESVVDRFAAAHEREPKPAKVTLIRDTNGKSIFDLCPSARSHLPKTFAIVDPRPRLGPDPTAPSFGFNPDSFVYELGVPKLVDATQATVAFGYSCDGLCGGGWTETFAMERGRWRWLRRNSGWIS